MSQTKVFLSVVAAAVVLLAGYQYRPELVQRPDSKGSAESAPLSQSHVPLQPSINSAQQLAPSTLAVSSGRELSAVSGDTAVNEFLRASNLAETHAKLSAAGTPQALFVMAHIQDLCRRVADVEKQGLSDPRELPIFGGENLDLRQQAQARLKERSSRRLCKGFPPQLLSDQSIKSAYDRASAAGDLRAKLRGLEERLIAERIALPVHAVVAGQLTLTADDSLGVVPALPAADLALLRSAFESRDAVAIRAAGPLLAGAYRDTAISFGPLNSPVDDLVGDAVWTFLACRYSGGCDATSTEVSESCLLNSRCSATSLEDHFARYRLKPEQLQDVLTLVARFQGAIENGDWSFLQVKPNANFRFDRTAFPSTVRPFIFRP
jgi:hypothetical protein